MDTEVPSELKVKAHLKNNDIDQCFYFAWITLDR